MTTFDIIKKLSHDRGKNLKEVAKELGFGENLFYKWKTQSPTAEKLQKVADYFKVSTDYLLGRTDNEAIKSYTSETMNTVNKIIKSDNPIFMELIEKLSMLNDEEVKVLNSMADSLIALK